MGTAPSTYTKRAHNGTWYYDEVAAQRDKQAEAEQSREPGLIDRYYDIALWFATGTAFGAIIATMSQALWS